MGRDTVGRLIDKTRESLHCVPTDGETLQEEFAPCRGSSTGVVARAVVELSRDIESLPLAAKWLEDFVLGRILAI